MKKVIFITIATIVLSIVAYGAYAYYQISNPKGLFEETDQLEKGMMTDKNGGKEDRPANAEIDPLLENPYQFDNRVNFLFLGLDASVERYETMGSFRTDTIMLISIDFESEEVHIISIPRDSYVKIPGREKREKINAAFTRGGGFKGKGFDKTLETVSHFLGGIPIHYYIGVDMNVVKEVVDIMGGIDYDVDLRVQIGERVVEEGFQHLNGQQVLDYARTRKTGRGDIDRIDRQQRIVLAMFKELKSTKQLLKLPQYYTTVMEKIHTNLDVKQVAALALFGTKMDMEQIHRYTVPGGSLYMDKISYWGIDENEKKKLVKEIFGVDIHIEPKNDIKYLKKEMEEKERAFKEAIGQSQLIISDAKQTMANYEKIIKDDEKSRLKTYINGVEHAIEDGNIELIKKMNSEFKQYIPKLKGILDERSGAIQKAQAVLAQVSEKAKKHQGFIKDEEKDALNNKIAGVNQAVNSRDSQSINRAVQDLESYGAEVFNNCQQRKEAKEKEEKAAIERDKAIQKAQAVLDNISENMEKYKDFFEGTEQDNLNKKISSVKQAVKSKDTQSINKAAKDLESYGSEVFSACQQRKDAIEKENPNPEVSKVPDGEQEESLAP